MKIPLEKIRGEAKLATIATITAILLISSVYAAYKAWQHTTKITVLEPFQIESNLPEETTLYPGSYSYSVNVTNKADRNYLAIFYYSLETVNCTVTVTPANGTAYGVMASSTTTISVNIDVDLEPLASNGTATIVWWIERQQP